MKHVNIDIMCPWCHLEPETDTHVLFLCEFAKIVWHMTGMNLMANHSAHESAAMVIRRVFDSYSQEQCVQMVMVSWGLWNRRNKWVWDRTNGSSFGVMAATNHLLKEWRSAQIRDAGGRQEGGAIKWEKPTEGLFKIMDAAVFQDSIGCGAIIRDAQGVFMGAMCKKVEGAWTPREAETIALKEALSWIIELKYEKCVIETDSKALAQACKKAPGESFFGTIVGDCVHLLKHINQVLIQFVFRSANSVAHELARATYSMSDRGEWYVTPPNFLSHVLEFDLI